MVFCGATNNTVILSSGGNPSTVAPRYARATNNRCDTARNVNGKTMEEVIADINSSSEATLEKVMSTMHKIRQLELMLSLDFIFFGTCPKIARKPWPAMTGTTIFQNRPMNTPFISCAERVEELPFKKRLRRNGDKKIPTIFAKAELKRAATVSPPLDWVKTTQVKIVVGKTASANIP